MQRKRFIFKNEFEGLPKPADFELIEEELPEVKDGEVLFQAMFLSVDPYMRSNIHDLSTGRTMFGQQVAKVVQSKHSEYNVDDIVTGYFGWTTHSLVKPEAVITPFPEKSKPSLIKNLAGQPPSVALGALGKPGYTAYCGLVKVLTPKTGEVLVVSSAAGAVGSIVGQIAKILKITVIGFAGTDEKVKMLKEELHFDYAFNYKTENIGKVLKTSAPNGPDIFFDNVGGKLSEDIMNSMKVRGRVVSCGRISQYNIERKDQRPSLNNVKSLKILVITPDCLQKHWQEGLNYLETCINNGKLIVKETITQGFENMPNAFIGLFSGQNTGKAIVQI